MSDLVRLPTYMYIYTHTHTCHPPPLNTNRPMHFDLFVAGAAATVPAPTTAIEMVTPPGPISTM